MNYRVHLPMHVEVAFPDLCPFTETARPSSKVKLKITSTSAVVPVPGGAFNSYSQTALTFPAAKNTALATTSLGLMVWISIVAGMALCAWGMQSNSDQLQRMTFLFVPAGLIAALVFRMLRACVLRNVRIKKPWNGFVEVVFKSEKYAKEFAAQNRLTVSAQ